MGRERLALLGCLVLALAIAPTAHAQSFEPRIVGGSTTTIEQYPWQAAVVYDPAKVSGNPFQRQFCGGSLITPYIVLTAGHCVYDTDPQNNSSLDPDDVDVVLGQTTLSTAPPASEFNVQGVAYQANYDPSYGQGQGVPSNDVGYLVLQTPYNATTPIDIAGADEGALWDPGSPEQITGWGATAESGPGSGGSDTLRVATVPIAADSTCAADYGTYFNGSTMVCAGYTAGGIDTCYGDSGGPMQAGLQGGGYRLVGITSWGGGCARSNAPGVYTRVAGDALRSAVASTVFNLETRFGLPHENIIGGTTTTRTLTVSLGGSGTGSVTGPGISCPGDCTEAYANGTSMALTAAGTGGSTFAGWGGACSGTGSCQLTMDADKAVSAGFTAPFIAPPLTPPSAPGAAPSPGAAPPACNGIPASIVGTDGSDVLSGTPARDVIAGLGGNDKLSGLAGDDVICGGAGKDTLRGGKGNDKLYGEAGKDTLKGGPGNDKLKGGGGKDKLVQ
jgi:secreted trypsin-like serine protease